MYEIWYDNNNIKNNFNKIKFIDPYSLADYIIKNNIVNCITLLYDNNLLDAYYKLK